MEENKNCIFMVFEYMEHDLLGLIARKVKFSMVQIKYIMLQILTGLNHMHQKGIIHRDIKSRLSGDTTASNILVNKKGEVKVGDFGLGRINPSKNKPLTIRVMTMIYRSPEVALGMHNYSFKVDVWSAGCVLAELLISEPLFCTAKTANNLVDLFFSRMGTPDEVSWPGVSKLPLFEELSPKRTYEGNLTTYIYKKNPKYI